MADLTLAHLRVLVEVAGRGSISAAATALGYTQSSISRQLQGAEAAAGAVLFERSASGVRPTAAGDALLPHARRMLRELESAETDLAELRGGLTGPLAVGAYPLAHAWIVPRALARVLGEHPGIRPEPVEASSPVLVRRVRAGLLHAALIAVGDGLPDYDLDGLAVARMPQAPGAGVMVPRRHPLADRRAVRRDELAGLSWAVGAGDAGDPQFGVWPGVEDARVAFRVRGWQARAGLVQAGLAVSVAPASIAPVLPVGVVWLPVEDAAFDGRRMVVISPPDPSAGARAFVASVAEAIRELPVPRERS